jgi:hypothetical protein
MPDMSDQINFPTGFGMKDLVACGNTAMVLFVTADTPKAARQTLLTSGCHDTLSPAYIPNYTTLAVTSVVIIAASVLLSLRLSRCHQLS